MISIEKMGDPSGSKKIDYKYQVRCNKCDTIFTFNQSDMVMTELSRDGKPDIICPVCKKIIFFSHAKRIYED